MTKLSVVELWDAIRAWYAEHLPEVLASLNPGASEEALDALRRELKGVAAELPGALLELYRQNDGQDRASNSGVFFGLPFLSLEYALFNWKVWKDIGDETQNAVLDENCTSYPPGAVRPVYTHAGWIPFAHDGGGNHIGIDISPGPAGQVGQVINFGRDENSKYVMAPSLGAFLEWQLAQLQNDNFIIRTETSDGQLERYVEIRTPHNAHLPDAVPKLFGPKRQGFWWRPRA